MPTRIPVWPAFPICQLYLKTSDRPSLQRIWLASVGQGALQWQNLRPSCGLLGQTQRPITSGVLANLLENCGEAHSGPLLDLFQQPLKSSHRARV